MITFSPQQPLSTTLTNGFGSITSIDASNSSYTVASLNPYGKLMTADPTNTTLEVNGRIKLNGEFLDDRLERIEKVLSIPTRDVIMESKYPRLQEIFAEYVAELEKYKTWERLKNGKE